MKRLIFSTSNEEKFITATHTCEKYGVGLDQSVLDITEIQEEDPEKVAIDKAMKAFSALNKPVIISDDSWSFSGLRGFPGVYMHSMNVWFRPEDFLHLTQPLKDRNAVLTQYLAYTDGKITKTFQKQSHGILLKENRGTSPFPAHTIIAMDSDHGLSIAEAYDKQQDKSKRESAVIWREFAEWFLTT